MRRLVAASARSCACHSGLLPQVACGLAPSPAVAGCPRTFIDNPKVGGSDPSQTAGRPPAASRQGVVAEARIRF